MPKQGTAPNKRAGEKKSNQLNLQAMKRAFLVFLLVFGFSLQASNLLVEEPAVLQYLGWKLPPSMSPTRIEKLINQFTKATYGKAFRYIGVAEDYFHGHILFEEKTESGKPQIYMRAILYHTQEEAHKAHHEKTVPEKYDYVNVTTRNWIQWLDEDPAVDGTRIENAREYAGKLKYSIDLLYNETLEPQKGQHYTIHSKYLDPAKTGFKLYGELMLEFFEESCQGLTNDPYDFKRGPIQVELEPGKKVCLALDTGGSLVRW